MWMYRRDTNIEFQLQIIIWESGQLVAAQLITLKWDSGRRKKGAHGVMRQKYYHAIPEAEEEIRLDLQLKISNLHTMCNFKYLHK